MYVLSNAVDLFETKPMKVSVIANHILRRSTMINYLGGIGSDVSAVFLNHLSFAVLAKISICLRCSSIDLLYRIVKSIYTILSSNENGFILGSHSKQEMTTCFLKILNLQRCF
jgi:hypothetical protein